MLVIDLCPSVPQHVRVSLELQAGGSRSTLDHPRKQAVVNGEPRSLTKTSDLTPGVLLVDDMAIDRLLGRGVIFGICNMALQNRSRRLAANAGVSAEEAHKDWVANVVPGLTVIPSGTWGVNRAQEAGCTYCAGG